MEILNACGASFSSVDEISEAATHISKCCDGLYEYEFFDLVILRDFRVFARPSYEFDQGSVLAEISMNYPFDELIRDLVLEACREISDPDRGAEIVSVSKFTSMPWD